MTLPTSLTTVTTFSKYLALSMFIIFPILGFFLGIWYEKTTRVESITQSIATPTPTYYPKTTPMITSAVQPSPQIQIKGADETLAILTTLKNQTDARIVWEIPTSAQEPYRSETEKTIQLPGFVISGKMKTNGNYMPLEGEQFISPTVLSNAGWQPYAFNNADGPGGALRGYTKQFAQQKRLLLVRYETYDFLKKNGFSNDPHIGTADFSIFVSELF